jgi:hypothetical protein
VSTALALEPIEHLVLVPGEKISYFYSSANQPAVIFKVGFGC